MINQTAPCKLHQFDLFLDNSAAYVTGQRSHLTHLPLEKVQIFLVKFLHSTNSFSFRFEHRYHHVLLNTRKHRHFNGGIEVIFAGSG